MAYSRSRETNVQPDQVWKIWSDTSTWAKWNPDVPSVSLDGPFASGTTARSPTLRGYPGLPGRARATPRPGLLIMYD
jgi:hypothetical protein